MRNTIVIALAAVLIVAGLSVLVASASSHSDAPLISQDREANNTDVYAFVSTETGHSDHVTLIANYIPMEEPIDGPYYPRFGDDVLYEIMVDTNGDAKEDLTYQFDFNTIQGAITLHTFLYSTGLIGMPVDPADPSSQYTNLNMPTSYTLTEVRGDRRKHGDKTVLLENARAAPIHVGPKSTGTKTNYEALAAAAVHTIGASPNDIRVFAGPRDEGFFVDLGGCCLDLINLRNPGVDSFSGFNVHSIAIEIPKARLTGAGDTDGRIGVWASASRRKTDVLNKDGDPPNDKDRWIQVSRLGNPLVNELLIPLSFKDAYNATHPKKDGDNIANFIVNPGIGGAEFTLTPLLVDFVTANLPPCNTPKNGRSDLELALLKGIPAGVLGFPGNQDTQQPSGPTSADMIRLNFNVPPDKTPSPLGIFEEDVSGFPNGRRPGDDVVDIEARVASGAVLHLLGAANCPASLVVSDNAQANDVPYLDHFPYLGTPHQGYIHHHDHGNPAALALGVGFGLLAAGLGVGLVFTLRRRSQPVA